MLLPTDPTTEPPAGQAPRRGLSRAKAQRLLATYTRPGDLVLDLDAAPTLAAAADWLDRRTATTLTRSHHRAGPRRRGRAGESGRNDAALLLVTLPRVAGTAVDLHDLTEEIRYWRGALAPGGFLVVVLTGQRHGGRFLDHATTLITAARAAGLTYHQHLIDVLEPLPEHEPRATAEHAASTRPHLLAGQHAAVHRDLFVFAAKEPADA